MAVLKAGSKYVYNTRNGAVYPASPELDGLEGMKHFTADSDREFDRSMLDHKPAHEQAEAPKAAQSAEVEVVDKNERPMTEAKPMTYRERLAAATKALGASKAPTLAATDDPTQ